MKNFKLTYSRLINLIIVVLVFVLGTVIGSKYGSIVNFDAKSKQIKFTVSNIQTPSERKDVNFGQFWEVWGILADDYIDSSKLNDQKMVEGAIGGMTAALGDPYTIYLPPEQDKRAAESLAGSFFGVGIELGYIEKTVGVMAPIKGLPAEKAGVKAGDIILHIKDENKGLDEDSIGWTLQDAVDKIRGEKGTKVTLTLLRPSEKPEPFTVDLVRDQVVIPSVELTMEEQAGKKVAHIVLSRFGERTHAEWEEVVKQILAQKSSIAGIALDMRNNPGGFFDGAVEISSDFIQDGVVVSQQGKFTSQPFKTTGLARLKGIPTVVLVNKGSASASEIVAGALKDNLNFKLIGENTFGKGTVQDRRELSGGGGLHVTIAKWIMPKGEWINEKGIPVDVEVKDDSATEADEVLNKAIELL
ncbi:S41 family peptidase [Patescibacteria group bacterium]|nr:S41 family peptidase [Patescibacteria group bacterium]